jgi:hypothetical protein
MKRVTGIAAFFQGEDPQALRAWYQHLGIDVQEWGGTAFVWTANGMTVWSVNSADSDYFAPGTAPFMINYRVEDLAALLQVLREEGCNVVDKMDESGSGSSAG